jgi:hypothetical protein
MKISCIILFCDRDYIYIPELLNNIHKNLKIDHEIILVDNREEYKDIDIEIPDEIDVSYIDMGRNFRQLQARKFASQNATGDYIWFIDADDNILEVNDSIERRIIDRKFPDMIVFNYNEGYTEKDFNTVLHFDDTQFYTIGLINKSMRKMIDVFNWNKWYKKDKLDKVMEKIPDGFEVSAYEDNVIVSLMLKEIDNLYTIARPIYFNNLSRSLSAKDHISSVLDFENLITGVNLANLIISQNYTEDEKQLAGLRNLTTDQCAYFLWKLSLADDLIKDECIELLYENWSYDIVLSVAIGKLSNFLKKEDQKNLVQYIRNYNSTHRIKNNNDIKNDSDNFIKVVYDDDYNFAMARNSINELYNKYYNDILKYGTWQMSNTEWEYKSADQIYICFSKKNFLREIIWLDVILDNNSRCKNVTYFNASNINIKYFEEKYPSIKFHEMEEVSESELIEKYFINTSSIDVIEYGFVLKEYFSFINDKRKGAPMFIIYPFDTSNIRGLYLAEYFKNKNYRFWGINQGEYTSEEILAKMASITYPLYFIDINCSYEPFISPNKIHNVLEISKIPFVYDCADNYPEFSSWINGSSKRLTLINEKYLCENALGVTASAPSIEELLKERHNVTAIKAYNGYKFKDVPKLEKKNKIIILGSNQEKTNCSIIEEMIIERPDYEFHFYGKDWSKEYGFDKYDNFILHEWVDIEEIYQTISEFKCGIIAFKNTPYTKRGMLPLKTFDYLVGHMPIAYTNAPELKRNGFEKFCFDLEEISITDILNKEFNDEDFEEILKDYDMNKSFDTIFNIFKEDYLKRYGFELPDHDEVKLSQYPSNDFSIILNVGHFCNYRCSYCFEKWDFDQGKFDTSPLYEILNNMHKVKEYYDEVTKGEPKSLTLTLIGGETTCYPMLECVKAVNKHIPVNWVTVISNVSMPEKIVELKRKLQDMGIGLSVSASFHEDCTTIEKYTDTINYLIDNYVQVECYAVLNEHNFEDIWRWKDYLHEHAGRWFMFGIERQYYKSIHISIDKELRLANYYNKDLYEGRDWYKLQVTMKSGNKIRISAWEEIYNILGQTLSTKGARCNIGKNHLYIQSDGLCKLATSQCNKSFCNILTEDKLVLNEECIKCCPIDRCECTAGDKIEW